MIIDLHTIHINEAHSVYLTKHNFKTMSILYDDYKSTKIDDFVRTLQIKERYSFISFNNFDGSPKYILAYYDWYNQS